MNSDLRKEMREIKEIMLQGFFFTWLLISVSLYFMAYDSTYLLVAVVMVLAMLIAAIKGRIISRREKKEAKVESNS